MGVYYQRTYVKLQGGFSDFSRKNKSLEPPRSWLQVKRSATELLKRALYYLHSKSWIDTMYKLNNVFNFMYILFMNTRIVKSNIRGS